ncbi:MAG: hypothetical protein ACXW1N_08705 [Halobacteriota archaeon]
MNSIIKMMKRYINMPLKYALPLLFISSLVLASTTGCVSNTSTNQADITSYLKLGNTQGLFKRLRLRIHPQSRITRMTFDGLTIRPHK